MNIATHIARYLLGLVFVVFGLNGYFNFLPLPTPKVELAAEFVRALSSTHYMHAVKAFEVLGGLMLLSGRYVPLGLTLLGPVIVNILLFGVFLDPPGLPLGLLIAAMAGFLLWRNRDAFAGLLKP